MRSWRLVFGDERLKGRTVLWVNTKYTLLAWQRQPYTRTLMLLRTVDVPLGVDHSLIVVPVQSRRHLPPKGDLSIRLPQPAAVREIFKVDPVDA